MTNEQREHIVSSVAIMDMAAAILSKCDFEDAANVVTAQCEILQEVLDHDRRTET